MRTWEWSKKKHVEVSGFFMTGGKKINNDFELWLWFDMIDNLMIDANETEYEALFIPTQDYNF